MFHMKRILALAALAALAGHGAIAADVPTKMVLDTGVGSVELMSEPGPCVAGARRALFTPHSGDAAVPGCWRVLAAEHAVVIAWMDGTADMAPIAAFKVGKSL